MKLTTAWVVQLCKDLETLDKAISSAQVTDGTCKNNAMARGDGEMEKYYQDCLDKYMEVRAAIDTVIEYVDGLEVHL